jgi:hypothetical protein
LDAGHDPEAGDGQAAAAIGRPVTDRGGKMGAYLTTSVKRMAATTDRS